MKVEITAPGRSEDYPDVHRVYFVNAGTHGDAHALADRAEYLNTETRVLFVNAALVYTVDITGLEDTEPDHG